MAKFLKNMAIVIGVLIISSGIYILVSEDQELKQDVFKRSLDLLGEQLFSSIQEGKDRKHIEEKWQEISEKANNGEVEAEQFERMAVGILNASNLDEEISVEEADDILNVAFTEVPEESIHSDITIVAESHDKAESTKYYKQSLRKRLERVGENLEVVCNFNEKMKESCDDDPVIRKLFVKNIRYKLDNGIRLSADMALKSELKNRRFQEWNQEFKQLDNNQLVEWRHNFALELDEEREQVRLQLDSLMILVDNQNIQIGKSLKLVLANKDKRKALQKLEKLQDLQVLDAKTIEKIIHERLQAHEIKIEDH